MTTSLRWGILGASNFALNNMAPAIHAARGATLAAVASRDPSKVAPFSAFAPGLQVHDSYDALLADPQIDAVYIPLPNHLHVEWSIKAAEAGKHVLCEKPIALQASDFDRLIAARDASGCLMAEAFMILHHPQWQEAKRLIDGGAIGRLKHVEAIFTYDMTDDPGNIRNQPNMGGGGLRDIGVYIFGSVRYATGQEPTHLGAKLEIEQDYDTYAWVTAEFPDFTYSGLVSTRMARRQGVVFHGSGGSLRVETPFNAASFGEAVLTLTDDTFQTTQTRYPDVQQYVLQVEAFGASVRDGAAYPVPLEFSRGTQEMIDRALATGR